MTEKKSRALMEPGDKIVNPRTEVEKDMKGLPYKAKLLELKERKTQQGYNSQRSDILCENK